MTRIITCAADGPTLRSGDDVLDIIGDALGQQADLVVVPVERLADEFFTLRTGLAGEIAQKFVNYRLRLAIVGDISGHLDRSPTLRDFVSETNRGNQLWFASTQDELRQRLGD